MSMIAQINERTRPEISVIVPVYNVAPYLAVCLDSVIAQTFRDFELIIVEDGSTDGSREIAEAYAAKDARVRLVEHRWNHGFPTALNHGLEVARGRYVIFVDSDDIVLAEYLITLYRVAEQMEADVVQAGFQAFHENLGDGKRYVWTNRMADLPGTLEGRIGCFLPVRIHIAQWCKLFRRDFLNQHRLQFYDVPVAADVSFHFSCVLTARRYLVLPNILYHHRDRAGSLDSVRGLERAKRCAVAMARILKAFTEWLQQEPMFQDVQVQHQLRQTLYVFLLHQLRELTKTCDAEEVFAHARTALAQEATEALRDAALYDALMRK